MAYKCGPYVGRRLWHIHVWLNVARGDYVPRRLWHTNVYVGPAMGNFHPSTVHQFTHRAISFVSMLRHAHVDGQSGIYWKVILFNLQKTCTGCFNLHFFLSYEWYKLFDIPWRGVFNPYIQKSIYVAHRILRGVQYKGFTLIPHIEKIMRQNVVSPV